MSGLEARFDWYEMTADGLDDGRVAIALALHLGATITSGKGRNGYAVCEVVERNDEVLAQVYGRSASAGEVHVTVTSEACDEVVPLLRTLYPDHRVSRADSAVDLAGDFDALDAVLVDFAEARGLSHSLWKGSDGGATRYLGSRHSEVSLRAYKKTEQLRSLHPERAHEVPDGVLRFEVEARPGKRAVKQRVSLLTADDLWGLSEWSTDLAALVLGLEAERTPTHFRRPPDWTRALHFLGQQYGPSIARRAESVGLDRARAEVLAALGLEVES